MAETFGKKPRRVAAGGGLVFIKINKTRGAATRQDAAAEPCIPRSCTDVDACLDGERDVSSEALGRGCRSRAKKRLDTQDSILDGASPNTNYAAVQAHTHKGNGYDADEKKTFGSRQGCRI